MKDVTHNPHTDVAFGEAESAACRRLVEMALAEDLGAAGDLTSLAIIAPDAKGKAVFVARADGVVAGLPAARLVIGAVDRNLSYKEQVIDGSFVEKGSQLAH